MNIGKSAIIGHIQNAPIKGKIYTAEDDDEEENEVK